MKLYLEDGSTLTLSPGAALVGLGIVKFEMTNEDLFHDNFGMEWFEHLLTRFVPVRPKNQGTSD